MGVLEGSGAEAHREQSSAHVHEAHKRRAQRGYVTGGRVFGHRNKHVFEGTDASGNPLKSDVDREIDAVEAASVVRAFELPAEGHGLKAIAKRLTAEDRPCPKPYKRKSDATARACPTPVVGWSPSTVRAILGRELYRGRVVWNRSRKRDDWGQVDQRPRDPSEHVEAVREDVRIITALTRALEVGGDVRSLVERLRELERARAAGRRAGASQAAPSAAGPRRVGSPRGVASAAARLDDAGARRAAATPARPHRLSAAKAR